MRCRFLYEMQRETDLERLFQGHLFRLAKAEDDTKLHETRTAKLESQVKTLVKQLGGQDITGRLSTCTSN